MTASSIMGFVLAGGASSRMGVDKALLTYRGRTLLERALETLNAACGPVAIVGDPEKFSRYGTTIPDVFPGCGPLAGIHAALSRSAADLNVVLAVDMPFASPQLLAFLLDRARETEALAVVPRTTDGWQPLCAVYRRSFAAHAGQALQAGNYKIDALFLSVPVLAISAKELAAAGFVDQVFCNLNTPQDIAAAENA